MCCFTAPVEHVLGTSIFARMLPGQRQAIVYSMSLAAQTDVAMVLPIPIWASAGEESVRFVSLEGYPTLFDDLASAFPIVTEPTRSLGAVSGAAPAAMPRLVVHPVGEFEASFVPRVADFDRLDPRFRMSPGVWAALPAYADFGFAVFKLRAGATAKAPEGFFRRLFRKAAPAAAVTRTFHPMAFSFPTRAANRLFFPTVHVHDGVVRPTADFDHALYLQGADAVGGFRRSDRVASFYVDGARTAQLVEPTAVVHRRTIIGDAPNEDTWVDLAAA